MRPIALAAAATSSPQVSQGNAKAFSTTYQTSVAPTLPQAIASALVSGQGTVPRGINPGGRGITLIGPK